MDNIKTLENIVHLYRNQKVSKETFIGLVVCLVLDKNILHTNSETADFIKYIFNIEFPAYIIKSRTLMIARLCRLLNSSDSKTIEKYSNNIYKFVKVIINNDFIDNVSPSTAKPDSLSNMNKWIAGILNKDR